MTKVLSLGALPALERPSISDQVFDVLRRQILTLTLTPGTKVSEVEVANQMGVSRQPVRDAFYRLSKQGFLTIRPQRATQVSLISRSDVNQANFIRTALECETSRVAATQLSKDDLKALETLIQDQMKARDENDKTLFHDLDDVFHQEICNRTGAPQAWDIIYETKAHMDRVRMLSLDFAISEALDGHIAMFEAMSAKNADAAVTALRAHLGRITLTLDRIRASNLDWFTDDD